MFIILTFLAIFYNKYLPPLKEDLPGTWLVVSIHLKKYARQIGHLPQIGLNKQRYLKIFEDI